MNKINYISIIFLVIVNSISIVAQTTSREFNINKLSATVSNTARFSGGLVYPTGTRNLVLSTGGIWLGAKIKDTMYLSDFTYNGHSTPGIILPDGKPDSVIPSIYHVYRILKGWEKLKEGSLKDSYRKDYEEWPSNLGAPTDAKGKPSHLGDQTLWLVVNDMDSTKRRIPYDTYPLGAELQITLWGFQLNPVLNSTMFARYKIINKSRNRWDSTFIGIYADTQIEGQQNYAGGDTTLQLGYTYTPLTTTRAFPIPPALGIAILQGPLVPSAGSIGYQSGREIPNTKNLPLRSFLRFDLNSLSQRIGHLISYEAIGQYNALKGLWADGTPVKDPFTGKITLFTAPGDPIYKTGWSDYTEQLQPGFRDLVFSMGPLTMAPGDTQEVVCAYVVGQGLSNLESINIAKYFTRHLQTVFNYNMQPIQWIQPKVTLSQLSNRIVLSWDTTSEISKRNYSFQGYNVYQGESVSGPWHLVNTFDIKDDKILLLEELFNEDGRITYHQPKWVLPNKGVSRYIVIERDSIRQLPIYNGSQYYFAVTSFAHSSVGRPMVVESQIEPITVVPQDNMPGSEILNVNDEVPHSRLYDDVVSIKTINPDQMLNKKYRVSISVQLKDTTWSLIDVTNNKVLLTNKKEIHGETSSPIIDGFIPVVRANPEGARRDHQTPRGWEYIPTENRYFNGTAANYIMNGFNKGLTYLDSNTLFGRNSGHHYSKLKRVEIRFDKSKTQKVYRYVSMIRSFPFDSLRHPSFEPYVFRRGPGFVYQDFVEVPFTVWEVDPNDGDATPKQINAGFVETNDYLYDKSGKYVGKGNINGKWDPTPASEGGTELLHIFASTYSDSAIPPYTIRNLKWDSHLLDIQYVLWVRVDSFLRKDRKKTFDDGDKFIIQPNYPLIDGEVFEFETKAPIIGDMNRAKEQNALNKINVFPNPYLGGHREEQSLNDRFVIFNHLPSDCIIRIFTLAGTHVRTIHHQSTTSIFERWDLRNENGIFVASAVYIAYIEVPGLGTKVLKLAILMPEERRRTY